MNYETIHELLHHEPFQPLEVHLSNGERYTIRQPEFALLLKSRLVIGDPDTDRMTVCSLIHINSVQVLQSA